ncbi:MAG TPA: sialidase family protein, partial [Candidatus Eisenbacteria bacterium]
MFHATTRSRLLLTILTAALLVGTAFGASARERVAPWSIGKLMKGNTVTPPTPVQADLSRLRWDPGNARTNSPINNPDIQVFPSADPQTEVSVSVSYTNPMRFLITSNTTPTATGQGYFYSLNNGATWFGSNSFPNGNANFGDPVSLHDNLGNTFDVTLRSPSGIGLISSADYGVTWGGFSNIDPLNSSGCDKEMGHVDRKVGSPFENQVYVAWTDFNLTDPHVILTRSGDGYAARTDLSAALGPDLGQGVDITTGPGGQVYACWAVYAGGFLPEAGIGFARSTNGGVSWTPGSQIFAITGIRSSNGPNVDFNNTRVNGFPSISCDISTGANSGRIYIVYSDRSTGDSDIYLRHSDDQGSSWSAAVRVNPDPVSNGKQQWFPWIDCDPVSGDVSISYFSMDTGGSGFQTKTWVSHSTDGGNTFDSF